MSGPVLYILELLFNLLGYFSFAHLVLYRNFLKLPVTAVSSGHQSKSCSVYKKYENIFLPESIYLELHMFYKKKLLLRKVFRKVKQYL